MFVKNNIVLYYHRGAKGGLYVNYIHQWSKICGWLLYSKFNRNISDLLVVYGVFKEFKNPFKLVFLSYHHDENIINVYIYHQQIECV